ncbi:MAG TPA: PaaI family thioesterase [Prolixibacteraceae bacterium]|nr:PaaI family thioesterase [Prolixibacteraceae bacterium]
MRKILNPFAPNLREEYNCIGCSPANEMGFHLEFYDTGEELISNWNPNKNYMGYPDVLHGGIQSTLLDEIGGWTVYVKCGTVGVTQEMTVTYHTPLRISKGTTTIRCRLVEKKEKQAIMHATISDGEGKLCSEARLTFFIYPLNVAKKRFYYPGIEAFYKEG